MGMSIIYLWGKWVCRSYIYGDKWVCRSYIYGGKWVCRSYIYGVNGYVDHIFMG